MSQRIAYFVNHYPKVSHSFIRREILALERQGCDVLRIALRGWDSDTVDPLSLTLSLQGNQDERVQLALDELKGRFPW